MTRYEPAPTVDSDVARHFLLPAVDRAKTRLREVARLRAPAAKVWVTMADERVRPTHVEADGQIIPANLRYVLDKPRGGSELGRVPRDPALSAANTANCRCHSLGVPDALRRSIHASHTRMQGPRVHAQVYTDFPRAAESEFPHGEDTGGGWLRQAVQEVAGLTGADSRPRGA